jgi:hypothetical protein
LTASTLNLQQASGPFPTNQMKPHKLTPPRDLRPSEEASHIFRQDCSRSIPQLWLDLLLDEPRDEPRALSNDEARRVEYVALFVKARGNPLSEEELLGELARRFPALRTRIESTRPHLLAAKFEVSRAEPKGGDEKATAGRWEETDGVAESARRAKLGSIINDVPGFSFEQEIMMVYEAHLPLTDDALERIWESFDQDLSRLVGEDYESLGWVSFATRGVAVGPRRNPDTPAGAEDFVNACKLLYRRLRKEGLENPASVPSARRWWAMQAGVFLKAYRPQVLVDDDMRLLRGLAAFTLAQLRVALKTVPPGESDEADRRFSQRLQAYSLATQCLLIVDDLAFMLSQLLQLLRVSPVPLVGDDLAYWRGWRSGVLERIPLNLVNSVHCMAAGGETADFKLRRVREDLARFCLGRIGQRKGEKCGAGFAATETLVEPDPFWRACYMHAVDSLRVNPENKGHRALYWSMHHDPDDMVRDVAKDLYPRVERKREIADGSSPRRPLITAIWWMLQAHLLGLGVEPDETAIQATLAAMVRRTTESLSPAITAGGDEHPEPAHTK